MTIIPTLSVVCAVFRRSNGHIAAFRRAPHSKHPGRWEFPGGKCEALERPEDALIREIAEELRVETTVLLPLQSSIYTYPERSIHLLPFLCSVPDAPFQLSDHDRVYWDNPAALVHLDWLEADLPILRQLIT